MHNPISSPRLSPVATAHRRVRLDSAALFLAVIPGLGMAACSSGEDEVDGAEATIDAASPEAVVGQAATGLMVCNLTNSSIGVAVGYNDGDTKITEGWWNLSPRDANNDCATVILEPLQSRLYYVYALDYTLGGEWAGDTFMCTHDQEFTIRGVEDCVAHGYDRAGFVEIDTGDRTVHIVQLTDQQGVGSR